MSLTQKLSEWLGFRKAVQIQNGESAKFHLLYGGLLIGTLSVNDEIWTFTYSDEFKQKSNFRPIVEFPDVNQTYQSPELWQFFASRIPSPQQEVVEEILKKENIAEDNAVSLLQRFGKHTITNPFHLEFVT